jgi:hypothetical protein
MLSFFVIIEALLRHNCEAIALYITVINTYVASAFISACSLLSKSMVL